MPVTEKQLFHSTIGTESNEGASGFVFNVQRFSIHDGPGIRTTVFLKGCPLRCRWCHNPEGMERRPQMQFEAHLCIRCGRCVTACAHHAHSITESDHIWDPSRCVTCGECAEECFTGALELIGSSMSVAEVMAVVIRDKPFYAHSGGGMTLSGGEPLLQWDFTHALLQSARDEGLHTAIETSAYASWDRIRTLLPLIDFWMVDVKHTDTERHRELTGVPNEPILSNIRQLVEAGAALTLRVPWVPQQNADDSFLNGLIAFLQSLPAVPPVDLMPYHRLGQGKWTALGGTSPISNDMPAATLEEMHPWIEALASAGIKANAA